MPPNQVTFVQISDTHISGRPDYGLNHAPHSANAGAAALVHAVNNLPFKPDFVLHTGDVAYDPDASAYQTAREILGRLEYPIYYLAGNHDYGDALQRVLLNRTETIAPFHYTFELNNFQFICLDTNGPAEPPRGNVIPEQLEWLDQLCSAEDDRPLVIAMHHNPLPIGSPWLDDYMCITNGDAVHAIICKAQRRLRGVFFGHVHQSITYYRDGVLYAASPSSWVQFKAWPGLDETVKDDNAELGFNVITLSEDQTFIRRWGFRV